MQNENQQVNIKDLPPNKAWEYKIQSEYLDKLYEEKGYTGITRIPPGEFGECDAILEKGEERVRLEEKIVRGVYESILVELIEDIGTGKLGWYFGVKADYLVWVFCKDERPKRIWMIKWPEFKRWYAENCHLFTMTDKEGEVGPAMRFNKEGWGNTLYHLIPISAIPENLKKKVYESEIV